MTTALTLAAVLLSAAPPADVQDVIFFYDARPLFVRLHIEVEGKPYQAHWAETVAKLFKDLDVDGDGRLSSRERPNWLQQFGAGQFPGMNTRPQPQASAVDGLSTAADLAAYLRPNFGPFQLRAIGGNDAGPETLFNRLDADGDKRLSASELAAAGATLLKLDQDDDETLRAEELLPYQNPFLARQAAVQRNGPNNQGPPPPFVAIGPGEPMAKLARRLLTQYDKAGGPDDGPGKDNKLQPAEIGLGPDAFAAADQDGDGGLDSDELVRALGSIPPGLEVRVKMSRGKGGGKSSVEVVPGDGSGKSLAGAVRKGVGGGLVVALESQLIEINNPTAGGTDVREFYRQQFRQADADNNKYLDTKEAAQSVFGNNNNLFGFMDRDGDGKLFEKEMDAFVGGQVDAAESRTVLTVSDQGRSLFQVLDLNRDGKLSPRELRGASGKLPDWDRNGDGVVAADEIPRHYRLDFGPAVSPLLIQFGDQVPTAMTIADPSAPRSGPEWFRRMDLNLDGDVSPREFLGTSDQFRRLDADGDGLIDPSEAAKAR